MSSPVSDADRCPFCARVVEAGGGQATAFDDAMPVAEGHTLVVPGRHVERLEELGADEWRAVFDLVHEHAQRLADDAAVDGVNVGVNSGAAAGQTVGHAHVHVIPRRAGDVRDPRGGIRWVLPERAAYWEER